MWTLNPGVIANIGASRSYLYNLQDQETLTVRPEDLPFVTKLCLGARNPEPEQLKIFKMLEEQGWAEERQELVDDEIRNRLSSLDAKYAWCLQEQSRTILPKIQHIHSCRKFFNRGFGQFAALPETVARRVALLPKKPQNVLVLGDDDFLAVGLLAAGHRVTVIEIDDIVVSVLRSVAGDDERLSIVQQDLREVWPKSLHGQFDYFFADPLTNKTALQLFISRGLASLKPEGRGFVCVAEPGADDFKDIIEEFKLEVHQHFSDFNHYYGFFMELAVYTSDLFQVSSPADSHLLPKPDEYCFAQELSTERQHYQPYTTCFHFQNIDREHCHLVHLQTAIELWKSGADFEIIHEHLWHEENGRGYMALSKDLHGILIRIQPESGQAALFVSPSSAELENGLFSCLFGLFRMRGAVVQKRRLRGSAMLAID